MNDNEKNDVAIFSLMIIVVIVIGLNIYNLWNL